MLICFVLQSKNGARHGKKTFAHVEDGESKKVSHALCELNKRTDFLTSHWKVDQVTLSSDENCEWPSGKCLCVSMGDALTLVRENMYLVVTPQQEESEDEDSSSEHSEISESEESVVDSKPRARHGSLKAAGINMASKTPLQELSLSSSECESASEVSEPVCVTPVPRKSARESAPSSKKRGNESHETQRSSKKASMAKRPTRHGKEARKSSGLKRSFLFGSKHFIYHGDTNLDWPCLVVGPTGRDNEYEITIDYEEYATPSKIIVSKEQLLESTKEREQAFVLASDRPNMLVSEIPDVDPGGSESETLAVQANAEKKNEDPDKLRRLDEPVDVTNRLDHPCVMCEGWVQYEPYKNRMVYYALRNETMKAIASKMKVEVEHLVHHNILIYKELDDTCKADLRAEFVLPLKTSWSPVGHGLILSWRIGGGVQYSRKQKKQGSK